MFDLLTEGVGSIRLPCTWVLLVPAIGVTLFARRRSGLAMTAFVGATIIIAWLRFSGWWYAVPTGIVQVGLGLAMIVAAVIAWRQNRAGTDALAAGVAGLMASWAWIPCVGNKLGDLLNTVRDSPGNNFGGTAAYLVGILLPFIVLAAAGYAFPAVGERTSNDKVVAVGAIVLIVFGALFATTLFDDIASELASRSSV